MEQESADNATAAQQLPFFLDDNPLGDDEETNELDELALASQTEIVASSLRSLQRRPGGSPIGEEAQKLKAQQKREKIVKVKVTPPSELKRMSSSVGLTSPGGDAEPGSPLRKRGSIRYSSTGTSAFASTPASDRPCFPSMEEGPLTPKQRNQAGSGLVTPPRFTTPSSTGGTPGSEGLLTPEAFNSQPLKFTLQETDLYVQKCLSGGVGSPRQRAWSRTHGPSGSPNAGTLSSLSGTASPTRVRKLYGYDRIDLAQEVERFRSVANADDDDGACECDYGKITADTRGFDYSRYHAHALFHACSICSRQPSAFLCLHCFESFCPSHVEAHTNRSEAARESCTLYINLMDIITSFDRIFWCEKCKRFTWKYTDEYEPFTDQIAVTKGTYLDEPVTDVWMKEYTAGCAGAKKEQHEQRQGKAEGQSAFNFGPGYGANASTEPPFAHKDDTLQAPTVLRRRSSGTEACMADMEACQRAHHREEGGSSSEQGETGIQFIVENWHTGATRTSIRALGASMQGWRSGQEDAEAVFTIETKHAPGCLDSSCAVFCVFDGHGGDAVAKLVARDIKRHLEREFQEAVSITHDGHKPFAKTTGRSDEDVFTENTGDASLLVDHFTQIFTNAFLKLDKEIQDTDEGMRGDFNCVGCTACVIAIMEDFVICANVGDSGAVLFHPASAKKRRMSLMESMSPHSQGVSDGADSVQQQQLHQLHLPGGSASSSPKLAHQLGAGRASPPPPLGPPAVECCGSEVSGSPLGAMSDTGSLAGSPHTAIAIVPLSEAHRLSSQTESDRVKNAGYSIADDRIEGMLAVPRAFGDYDFKMCGSRPQGEQAVTAMPDVTVLPRKRRGRRTELASEVLEERDWTIVVACDGIWDTLPQEPVCKLIHRHLYGLSGPGACASGNPSPASISLGVDNPSNASFGSGAISGYGASLPEELQLPFVSAMNAVFDHCIAPKINDQGLGMDNMSLLILRPCEDDEEDDTAGNEEAESVSSLDP